MASYIDQKVTCKCCGYPYTARMLRGFHRGTASGLDTNPHHPAVYDQITMCPNCGYSAFHIQEDVPSEIRQFVFSEAIQRIVQDPQLQDVVKKTELAARIAHKRGNIVQAAYAYLMQSWYLRDIGSSPDRSLDKSIEGYKEYLQNHADYSAAIIFIDALRQRRCFSEAKETTESLLQYLDEEPLLTIVHYQVKLIEQADSAPHLLSEILS